MLPGRPADAERGGLNDGHRQEPRIGHALGVGHTVTRLGVRFVMLAGADSKAEADAMFAKSPAAPPRTG